MKILKLQLANKNLYLKEENRKDKKYLFKQIKLNNQDVYIVIKNDAYENMLSITDWRYPDPEELYEMFHEITSKIGFFILVYILPIFFHANDEELYLELRKLLQKGLFPKIRYKNIYIAYGNFEKVFTEIRVSIYIIILIFFIVILIKRIFYGGYIIYKLIKYTKFIFFSLIALNIIIFIINLILVVFSSDCLITESDYKMYNTDFNHTNIFYIQEFYGGFCEFYFFFLFYSFYKLTKKLIGIKNDLDK